jgi:hypothetical protein
MTISRHKIIIEVIVDCIDDHPMQVPQIVAEHIMDDIMEGRVANVIETRLVSVERE